MIHGKDATSGNSLLVFICREIQQALEFQPFDFLKGFAGDALKIAVHADGGLHDTVDLFFALGPLPGDGFSLAIEIFAHGGESLDNRLYALTESRAGEVLVNHFHLCLLPFGCLPRARDFD